MSRAVADWFQASALRGIPNAGWARAVSESFVSRRPGAGIAIRIGNDLRLAKMHSPAVAVSVPRIRHWPSGLTRPSDLVGDSASIHAGAHERQILNIPTLPEVMWSGSPSGRPCDSCKVVPRPRMIPRDADLNRGTRLRLAQGRGSIRASVAPQQTRNVLSLISTATPATDD